MLGKLIKHEWKSTNKVGGLMLGAMLLITFFGWLAFQTPMWRSISEGGGGFSWLDIFGAFTLVMYVILLIVVNYGIVIYLGVHFYKTMYTDEGYLLHTLPVTKHQILGSKILVGSLWVLIIALSMYLSIFILGVSMVWAILPDSYTFADFFGEFLKAVDDLFRLVGLELGINFQAWFIRGAVMILVSPFVSVTTLFGAVSIGQLASKHRVMMAILCYIGIMMGESILNSIARSVVTVTYLSSFGAYLDTNTIINSILKLLVAVALYFVSWYVTSNKLNME